MNGLSHSDELSIRKNRLQIASLTFAEGSDSGQPMENIGGTSI
jgi:hypothetical protein